MEDVRIPLHAHSPGAFTPQRSPSPIHYSRFPIEPLTFITTNKLGFCEGNIIKYVCRYPFKGGVDDLKKARHYLDELIKQHAEEEGNAPT